MRTFASLTVVPFFLCSCSIPHPLQDDVTDLPLSEIIRKVTCEAKEALDESLTRRDLELERSSYKQTNLELKALSKKLSLDKETKILNKTKRELDLDIAINDARKSAVSANLNLLDRNDQPSDKLIAEYREVLKIRARILERSAVHAQNVKDHNSLVEKASKKIADKTKNAKKRHFSLSQYYNHSMAYSFRFRIVETNALSASATWKFPVTLNGNLGSWSLGGTAGDTKQRESDRNVKLVLSFEDLHGLPCENAPPAAGPLRRLYYPITGNIGIAEVVEQYFRILDRSIRDQEIDQGKPAAKIEKLKSIFGKTDSYTDTILFTTTLTGSVTPSIALNPTLRETVSASLGTTGTRTDLHSVLISLSSSGSDDDEAKENIQKVLIVPNDVVIAR